VNSTENSMHTATTPSNLLTDLSVAKQLLFGNVLEENLFPYPVINERDREVLGAVGKGFKVAMGILNNGRTGLGGGAVGGMKALIRRSVAQAQQRKQFDRPIAEYGLVREKIAQMTVECFAAESAVWMVAHYIDSGCDDYSVEAAITKVFASEAMQRTAYESLQIAGGNGYMRELPYEQYVRDARILPIFEGTNEILRLYVALSSLKDVGASLKELKSAVGSIFNDPIKGFGVLSGYAERRFAVPRAWVPQSRSARRSHRHCGRWWTSTRTTPGRPREWPRPCCGNTARAFPGSSTRNGASRTS